MLEPLESHTNERTFPFVTANKLASFSGTCSKLTIVGVACRGSLQMLVQHQQRCQNFALAHCQFLCERVDRKNLDDLNIQFRVSTCAINVSYTAIGTRPAANETSGAPLPVAMEVGVSGRE